jgi:hypothetical protein
MLSPVAQRARPTLAGPASASAARDGVAQRGARWSGHSGANGGGRAPTMVRLPAGHGGGKNSSLELLVHGEEKKSGSAGAFLRRDGATVAGGGPVMVRREGEVSSMLHGRGTARGEFGRRSPWMKLATTSDGRTAAVGALGQRRSASDW